MGAPSAPVMNKDDRKMITLIGSPSQRSSTACEGRSSVNSRATQRERELCSLYLTAKHSKYVGVSYLNQAARCAHNDIVIDSRYAKGRMVCVGGSCFRSQIDPENDPWPSSGQLHGRWRGYTSQCTLLARGNGTSSCMYCRLGRTC